MFKVAIFFVSLRAGKRLRRRKWTELPTTEEVIKQVHAFAIHEDRSEEDDEPTIDFNFSWDRDNEHPIQPFDYSVHEPLLHAPEGANVVQNVIHEEPNEDDLSINNNDTEADIDQELTINKTDDDDTTNRNEDTAITADSDDTSITAEGDDIQQDQNDSITNTNDDNMHEDDQMETDMLATDEDQGAPIIENQGATEEEEKNKKKKKQNKKKNKKP